MASGKVPGYKVHLGDIPADWTPQDAEESVAQILDLRDMGADDYAVLPRLSNFGGRQMIVTWRSSVGAVGGQRICHDYTWADGTRLNAKFWTPRGYDPWEEDERFAGVPRPQA